MHSITLQLFINKLLYCIELIFYDELLVFSFKYEGLYPLAAESFMKGTNIRFKFYIYANEKYASCKTPNN